MSLLHTALVVAFVYWGIRIPIAVLRAHRRRFHVTDRSFQLAIRPPPSLSICVPARDEAANIGRCVATLLAQDRLAGGAGIDEPGGAEILIVDDRSSDGTADVALAAAAGDPRVRIIAGEGPPEGWKGKQAACHAAQSQARGEWLAFVDADVDLSPRALTVAIRAAQAGRADMVSWLGQLETRSFWEHVLMPFIGDLILLFTKLPNVNDPSLDPCLANGQFILISREAYDAVGGHEAVRSSVIDDVSLGRAVKFHPPAGSLRYLLLYSTGLMSTRMYEDLPGIWSGFAKNWFEASQRRVGLTVLLVVYLVWTSVLPWVALPFLAAAGHPDLDFAAGAILLTLVYRWYARRFSRFPAWAILLHPVAAAIMAGIAVDSTLRGLGLREPVRWKGRPV